MRRIIGEIDSNIAGRIKIITNSNLKEGQSVRIILPTNQRVISRVTGKKLGYRDRIIGTAIVHKQGSELTLNIDSINSSMKLSDETRKIRSVGKRGDVFISEID